MLICLYIADQNQPQPKKIFVLKNHIQITETAVFKNKTVTEPAN